VDVPEADDARLCERCRVTSDGERWSFLRGRGVGMDVDEDLRESAVKRVK
jgi:molybdenum cofactor biosynthesis enzyme MoaA